MLTDIFAYRYAEVPMWEAFEERDRKFIVQAYRIITEQLYPPYTDGKTNDWAQAKWKLINDRLGTELGLHELSQRVNGYYADFAGRKRWTSYTKSWHTVCKDFVCVDFPADASPDEFVKERLSFIELAFRQRGEDVQAANNNLPRQILVAKSQFGQNSSGITLPGDPAAGVKAHNKAFNDEFRSSVNELNERLRQARYGLNYHNGFIQISSDAAVEEQIETPFWNLVADPKWQNVDTDMKEALDLRDSGGRDPAWYAAKALESTIKIISKEKGWTHGKEGGPHNFIENLAKEKNGRFIDAWEATSLKNFFTDVRRPFGHGAGSDEMPELTGQQTNWAIEFCMSWVKSLIERM
ncbi:MAG: hypothetical protein IIA05_08320 [Proteobacteria bacterium]|nr:hypothetical protein [Pseudomonadota bacterium]